MCLVENAPHEKMFAYIQQRVCGNKAACQLFCSSLLFCFRELNRFQEISARDPRKILRVSWNSKLDPRNLVLKPRKSKLETRASKLDSGFSKTSRIENRVSSRDCQLTFERYCSFQSLSFWIEFLNEECIFSHWNLFTTSFPNWVWCKYAVWISHFSKATLKSNFIEFGSPYQWSAVWTGPNKWCENEVLVGCG